jgi:collagen type IV alpha
MYTVNPELIALAKARFEKSAVVPPGGGDPAAAGMPMDPAAMGAVPPAGPMDPAAAMGAMAPPADPAAMPQAPLPPATPTEAPAPAQGQKLKPEQMMQMLDYRLYNMQQQLTAVMNALGVQVAPESLVLPPGTTGAPPAEAALPGGPMAPAPAGPEAGGMPPEAGGMPPGAAGMPPEAAAGLPPKTAGWWEPEVKQSVSQIGSPTPLSVRAAALRALQENKLSNED